MNQDQLLENYKAKSNIELLLIFKSEDFPQEAKKAAVKILIYY